MKKMTLAQSFALFFALLTAIPGIVLVLLTRHFVVVIQRSPEQAVGLANTGKIAILTALPVSLVLLTVFFLVFNKATRISMDKARASATAFFEGDLSHRILVTRNDEVGEMGNYINLTNDRLSGMFGRVATKAHDIGDYAEDLVGIAKSLNVYADNLNQKSHSVKRSIDGMKDSMKTVVGAAGDASGNAQVVATNSSEMIAMVSEIAENAENARLVANRAVNSVDGATIQVNEMRQAVQDINQVIDVILDIGNQTKLLALNATIEAARAGESGKGFAVVAAEVKELSKQTNRATEDIRQRIHGIQESSFHTMQEIAEVKVHVDHINDTITSIASAVEEQAMTTMDISSNIALAAEGTQNVSSSVEGNHRSTAAVANDVAVLDKVTRKIAEASTQIDAYAKALTQQSHELSKMVGALTF